MDEHKGLRAVPPPLQLAYALWIAAGVANAVFYLVVKDPWPALRYHLAMGGVTVAADVLAIVGTFELARRLTGRASVGTKIAAWGFVLGLTSSVGWSLLNFSTDLYRHEWVFHVNQYMFFASSLVVLSGFAIAVWDRRAVAIGVLVVGLLTWPPPVLVKYLYAWVPDGNVGIVLQEVLWLGRLGLVVFVLAILARGAPTPDCALAASGLRTAAKALWLRVITAVAVVLLTLMAVGGRSSGGSIQVMRVAMLTGAVVNIIALVQFAIGALRAARAGIAELNRYELTLAGACSLWVAGVMVAQFPYLYRMLYKPDDFGSSSLQEYAQAFSIAIPLVVIAAIALVAVAIGHLAGQRGSKDLYGQAQLKGITFVVLMLVSIAIQAWMLPTSTSLGSFALLSLLAAGAGLVATIVIAGLCSRAAEELEREPGLPTASVVSDGS